MKRNIVRKSLIALLLVAGIFLFAMNASAQIAPYLTFGGNYQYNAGVLTFTDNYADWLDYTNYEYDCLFPGMGCLSDTQAPDPILGATVTFGTLTNSGSNTFSPSTLTVTGYFTATLDNFVISYFDNGGVLNAELNWGNLSNIQRQDGGSSRYVDELLANGGGLGNIYMSFTPDAGGTEYFTSNSSGSVGGIVAAPEPISAILFVTGGAVLAFRSYRKKRIQ